MIYALCVIQVIGVTRSFEATDSMFIASAIHLRAGFMDLQDMITEIGDLILPTKCSDMKLDSNDKVPKNKRILLYKRIKECTDFYGFLTE